MAKPWQGGAKGRELFRGGKQYTTPGCGQKDRSNAKESAGKEHFSATNGTETALVPDKVPATERKTNKAKGNKNMDMLEKARAGRQMAINGRGRSVTKAVPSVHLGNVTFISRRAQSARAF